LPRYNPQILTIDAAETRRYAGLRKTQDFAEKNIFDACEEALLLIDVRGVWQIYDYAEQTVASDPPFQIVGKSIVKHLSGCEKVICMAVTVGAEIEREINKKFSRGEYLASVLLDAAATATVEQAADLMEKNFAAKFSKDGYKLRWRFSPGYGDWDLSQQEFLFKISGAEQIGLRLTSAMMLEPRKSVTAIIGVNSIRNEELGMRNETCASCNRSDCPMRS